MRRVERFAYWGWVLPASERVLPAAEHHATTAGLGSEPRLMFFEVGTEERTTAIVAAWSVAEHSPETLERAMTLLAGRYGVAAALLEDVPAQAKLRVWAGGVPAREAAMDAATAAWILKYCGGWEENPRMSARVLVEPSNEELSFVMLGEYRGEGRFEIELGSPAPSG